METETDSTTIIHDFVTRIEQLHGADSYKVIKQVLEENKRMKDEIKRLETANKVNAQMLGQTSEEKAVLESRIKAKDDELNKFAAVQKELQDKSDQLRESNKEKKELQKERHNMMKEIEDLNITVQNYQGAIKRGNDREDQLKKDVESFQRKTDTQETELAKLKAFSVKMNDESMESCAERCQKMWKTAFMLVDTFFNRNLENSVLVDAHIWEALELHEAINGSIPIPASNSPVAKHMRVAALLKVFGEALCDRIFVTTYVTEDDSHAEFMGNLARRNSAQETYLRAVTLRSLQGQQAYNAKKNIGNVVDEVMDYAMPLLPPTCVEKLRNTLTMSCQEICKQWMELQKIRARVEASLEPSRRVEEWEAFQRVSTGDSATMEKKPNGILKPNSKGQAQPSRRPRVDMRKIYCTLWPSMIMVNEDCENILSNGVALHVEQWQEAKDEQATLPEVKFWGPNRRRRASARAANGAKPSISKDFLSNGDMGSSEGS